MKAFPSRLVQLVTRLDLIDTLPPGAFSIEES